MIARPAAAHARAAVDAWSAWAGRAAGARASASRAPRSWPAARASSPTTRRRACATPASRRPRAGPRRGGRRARGRSSCSPPGDPGLLRHRPRAGRALRAPSGSRCCPRRLLRGRWPSPGSACPGTTRSWSAPTAARPRAAVNAARAHPKVAVLTAPGVRPAPSWRARSRGLAAELVVAERLGEPRRARHRGTPGGDRRRRVGGPERRARARPGRARRRRRARCLAGRAAPARLGAPRGGLRAPRRHDHQAGGARAGAGAAGARRGRPRVGRRHGHRRRGGRVRALRRGGDRDRRATRRSARASRANAAAPRRAVDVVARARRPRRSPACPTPTPCSSAAAGRTCSRSLDVAADRARRAWSWRWPRVERVVPAAERLAVARARRRGDDAPGRRALAALAGLHRLPPTNPRLRRLRERDR